MARVSNVRSGANTRIKGPEFDDVVADVVRDNPGLFGAQLNKVVSTAWTRSGGNHIGETMFGLRMTEALRRLELAGRVSRSVIDGKPRWWSVRTEEGSAD